MIESAKDSGHYRIGCKYRLINAYGRHVAFGIRESPLRIYAKRVVTTMSVRRKGPRSATQVTGINLTNPRSKRHRPTSDPRLNRLLPCLCRSNPSGAKQSSDLRSRLRQALAATPLRGPTFHVVRSASSRYEHIVEYGRRMRAALIEPDFPHLDYPEIRIYNLTDDDRQRVELTAAVNQHVGGFCQKFGSLKSLCGRVYFQYDRNRGLLACRDCAKVIPAPASLNVLATNKK